MELEVVVGSYDSTVIGYSVDLLQKPGNQALKRKYHEKNHVGSVRCVASGGHYLASGGTDETIKLYDMRKHLDVGTLLHHEGSITCLCFHKATYLLSASEDGAICVWRCGGNWECLHTLTGHKYSVTSMSVHPSGKLALSVSRDRTVKTWNLSTGQAAFTLRVAQAADVVSWSPIGDHYVLAVDRTVMVYSMESGEPTCVFDVEKGISSMLFIQDSVLAVAGEMHTIALYSTTSGQLVANLEGHTSRVKGLALSPDNKLLFSASSDGAIRAWDLPQPLGESKCVCKAETGSRLTCITALWLERKEKQNKVADDVATAGRKVRHKRTLNAEDTRELNNIDGTGKKSKSVKKRQSKRISKV